MRGTKILEIKKRIVKVLRNKLEENLAIAGRQFERTRQDVIEAPGRMQSRYDSSKQESGYLADSWQNRIRQLKLAIITLKELKINDAPQEEITIGALVETEKDLYFVLPVGGGEKIKDGQLNKEVIIVTPTSPIGKSLLNKTAGDCILLGPKKLTIISVF